MRVAFLCVILVLVLQCHPGQCFYSDKSPVVSLTPEDFESKVINAKDETWIVEFYAPWCGHCKRLTPEWEGAAKALAKDTPSVKLAAVDADKYGELGSKFGVSGFPTIKIFGYDKTKPTEYSAGRQKADIIHTAKHEALNLAASIKAGKTTVVDPPAKERVPSEFYADSDVVDLYDDNFEAELQKSTQPVLVEFYAPWCGHCKQLTPTWKEIASNFAGSVKIAAIDAEANGQVARKYGVQGFPTIKFFAPGSTEGEEFNGDRSLQGLTNYCEQKAEQYPSGPFEVAQVKDQKTFEEECLSKLLCVTFFLPHIIDTGVAGRNAYIDTITAVGKKFRGKKVQVGWVAGGDHYDFEEAFGVTANYPTFVAIGAKKSVYSKHHGKFEADAMIASIQKLLSPRAGFHSYKKLPKLDADVELWDGNQYVAPVEDDE